ncbi:hypothetical protein ACIQOV_02855 [Kitasatospora sp. NPDC091257]|uniref:hypothetical protein n=1 Tax=Kitasatospora sp. NPDC091257 TaxID=3364084 RepID=UPI00381792C5
MSDPIGTIVDLVAAIEPHGYIAVSEHLLWTQYDGASNLAAYNPEHPPTWWGRFFDYL